MNKFWEWMEEQAYGRIVGEDDKGLTCVMTNEQGREFDYTKQMLIGYMIDYVGENDPLGSFTNAEAFYDYLETLIEEINNE